MKLIHLSDLHLGKRVNECSMLEDQQYILGEILRIIDSEAPDAVLIAGDVYDKSVPSAEAVTLLDDFLVQLASRRVQTCLISGNHDSAERLSFGGRLMDAAGIHIAPVYDGSLTPLTLSDEHGPVDIYLLPFLKPVQVRRFFPDEDIESYTDAMAAVLRAANVDTARRNVLVAHQFVAGAVPCESEELSVGGTDNVAVCVFDDFDYVALGHIHGPQKVGRETVRYCGTPLVYSRTEMDAEKSVTMVELGEKGKVAVHMRPLTPRRKVRLIRDAFDTLEQTGPEAGTEDDYYFIDLTDEEDIPNAAARLTQRFPNLLALRYDNKRTRSFGTTDSPEEVVEKTPMEQMKALYRFIQNSEMSEEAVRFVEKTMKKVEGVQA